MGNARVVSVSSRAVRSSVPLPVDVGLELAGAQLVLLAARRRHGHEAGIHRRVDRHRVALDAAPARERDPRGEIAPDEDRVAVLLEGQREIVERPGVVLERPREVRGPLDAETLGWNVGYLDQHVKNLA